MMIYWIVYPPLGFFTTLYGVSDMNALCLNISLNSEMVYFSKWKLLLPAYLQGIGHTKSKSVIYTSTLNILAIAVLSISS